MSNPTQSGKTWSKDYRIRLQRIIRELGGVATLEQLVKKIMSERPDASRASIRQYCNACCVNGTHKNNLFHRGYDLENHFLIRLDAKLYALFKPRYFDRIGIYEKRSTT